jgi:hypothetical protein
LKLEDLKKPFPEEDIEWRVQSSGKKNDKIWAIVLAYVTNRAIQDRLDDVCGPDRWKNEYTSAPEGGILCGISIRCAIGSSGGYEWVTKYDGASNTQVEAVKGGLSSAMKRAGSQWGIGRYLYGLDATFAIVTKKGQYSAKTKDGEWFKWNPPILPKWALPDEDPEKPEEMTKEDRKQIRANAKNRKINTGDLTMFIKWLADKLGCDKNSVKITSELLLMTDFNYNLDKYIKETNAFNPDEVITEEDMAESTQDKATRQKTTERMSEVGMKKIMSDALNSGSEPLVAAMELCNMVNIPTGFEAVKSLYDKFIELGG